MHKHRSLARPLDESEVVRCFSKLARELDVVLPISFFEKAGEVYFNSVAMADADGTILGVYRKSHIPNAPGYQEKEYFSPVTRVFVFGTPVTAKSRTHLLGPVVSRGGKVSDPDGRRHHSLPTAIGSGLGGGGDMLTGNDSVDAWRNAMCGHAACNILPVVASNRIAGNT